MDNKLEVEVIRHYLIDNKKPFEKEYIIEWVNMYASKFRDILNWGTTDILLIKTYLYGKN